MLVETLSTFPDMYNSVMGSSMMRIAQEKGYLDFHAYDLRDWTHDRHKTTDDDPYGGGVGLVMKCEPLFEAFDDISARSEVRPVTIFLSPVLFSESTFHDNTVYLLLFYKPHTLC